LNTQFSIAPTVGDCKPNDNIERTTQRVTGSFDPNEKEVFPAGDFTEQDSIFTYTIHFQNTGTDTTHFIVIKDLLSPHFDGSTLQTVASSHPYSRFDIEADGVLTWEFDPLFLPDSNTNEPASKGFVTYSVKRNMDIPLNTEIENTALIHFDFNPPVVTNTTVNTLVEPDGIVKTESLRNDVLAYPNPSSGHVTFEFSNPDKSTLTFELYSYAGKLLVHKDGVTGEKLKIEEQLAAGLYIYKLKGNETATGKLIIMGNNAW
ncbi:MAG TPA: T9SS type A sorting domain-containing protein, partial [Flavobacterium sp.]|nr:T9SS type A sorting domain-containing protein [Flavobacterium sp.]